ncbi:MAG TPA: phage holin family protein [Verrucomicrobiae bacterium]|nr:phage holin family protein [Verrucomicrobiae bacterium]
MEIVAPATSEAEFQTHRDLREPRTDTAATRAASLSDLVSDLTAETRTFIRQELTLAKSELSEKVGRMAREGAGIGVGGVLAYAAGIVLMLGVGFLIAWAIHLAGIEALFASFLGLFGVGLFVLFVGGILAVQGLAGLRKESLTPERTLHTLQELRGTQATSLPKASAPAEKVSPDQAQERVERTERDLGATLEELRQRMNTTYLKEQLTSRVSEHAYRWTLIAMGTGVVAGVLIHRSLARES